MPRGQSKGKCVSRREEKNEIYNAALDASIDDKVECDLDSHMGYHTGEQPFTCGLCGKGFEKASVLKQHKHVHWKKNCQVFEADKTMTTEDTENCVIKEEVLNEDGDPNSTNMTDSGYVDSSAVYIENAEHIPQTLSADMEGVDVKQENLDTGMLSSGEVTQFESRVLNQITASREDNAGVTLNFDFHAADSFENKNNNDAVVPKSKEGLLIVKNEKEKNEEDIDSVLDVFDNDVKDEDYVCSDKINNSGDSLHLNNKTVTQLSNQQKVVSGSSNNLTTSNNGSYISHKQHVADIVEGQDSLTMSRSLMSDADTRHVNGIKPPRRFESKVGKSKCTICGKEVSKLIQHMKVHSRIPMFKCEVCGREFIWQRCYTRHVALHSRERTLTCQECGKSCATVGALKSHKRVHNPKEYKEYPFICSVCDKTFKMACRLKAHLKAHTGERNYPCTICGKQFVWSHVLKNHLLTHTEHFGPREKRYPCSYCDKRFNSNQGAKEHMRTHTGEIFTCSECDKTYRSRMSFQYHMAHHAGLKPFDCNICGKSFAANRLLQAHLQCHEEKKNFCETCGNSFRTKNGLKNHVESCHTENRPRPFMCDQCGKDFVNLAGLKNHMLTHSNERNFECGLCGKKFNTNGNLVSHMQCHAEEKPATRKYSCQRCHRLLSRAGLKKHKCKSGNNVNKTLLKESAHITTGKSIEKKKVVVMETEGKETGTEN